MTAAAAASVCLYRSLVALGINKASCNNNTIIIAHTYTHTRAALDADRASGNSFIAVIIVDLTSCRAAEILSSPASAIIMHIKFLSAAAAAGHDADDGSSLSGQTDGR